MKTFLMIIAALALAAFLTLPLYAAATGSVFVAASLTLLLVADYSPRARRAATRAVALRSRENLRLAA